MEEKQMNHFPQALQRLKRFAVQTHENARERG
jgi:hypothetical protein